MSASNGMRNSWPLKTYTSHVSVETYIFGVTPGLSRSGPGYSSFLLHQAETHRTYLRIVEFGASDSCPRLLNAAFSFSFCEPRAGLAVSALHPIARSRQVYIELIVEALLITSGSLDALTKEEFRGPQIKAKASGDVSSVQILLSQQLALVGEARA
jgi:hypothetical protein